MCCGKRFYSVAWCVYDLKEEEGREGGGREGGEEGREEGREGWVWQAVLLSQGCAGPGCLLTTVALMQAVDTPRYATDIERMVAKLVRADSNRSGYYKDLCKY